MTSQAIDTIEYNLHTFTIHILPNISQSKGNQTMKFGQLIEYNRIFFKAYAENEAGKLVPEVFLFFKEA